MALVTERARAGIPAEMVQLVPGRRQLRPAHHLAVARRASVAVHDRHGVELLTGRVEGDHIGELLWRRSNRRRGRTIERRVRIASHRNLPSPMKNGAILRPRLGLLVRGDWTRPVHEAGGADYG